MSVSAISDGAVLAASAMLPDINEASGCRTPLGRTLCVRLSGCHGSSDDILAMDADLDQRGSAPVRRWSQMSFSGDWAAVRSRIPSSWGSRCTRCFPHGHVGIFKISRSGAVPCLRP